jgi:DNA-binding transcriptional regulator YiaG
MKQLALFIVALHPAGTHEVQMDEPAEWRALAGKFSELAQWADALHAGYGPPSTGAPWFLGGIANRRLHSSFLRYAERGAVLLGQPPGPNAAFYWLDLLKDGPYHDVTNLTHQTDDGRLESEQAGVIWHVCVACADQCYKFETLAVARGRKVIDGTLADSPNRKGRPVILVDGERIRELRGEFTQAVFARVCNVSVDAVQRAERSGRSSEKTIRKIVRRLRSRGQKIEAKDLIKNTPQ